MRVGTPTLLPALWTTINVACRHTPGRPRSPPPLGRAQPACCSLAVGAPLLLLPSCGPSSTHLLLTSGGPSSPPAAP
jgi:hypothetical protein